MTEWQQRIEEVRKEYTGFEREIYICLVNLYFASKKL